MQVIRKLVLTCIVPKITYGGETWEPNKGETEKLNQILDQIIKRVLMTPTSTPREALYIETGLLDIQTLITRNRINMKARLNRNTSELMENLLNYPGAKWSKKTSTLMQEINITNEELEGTKHTTKKIVETKTAAHFKNIIHEKGENKSKIQNLLTQIDGWEPEKTPNYLN